MSAASSCPAPLLSTSESPMENLEENLNKLKLLEAPTGGDSCVDDEDEKATLKPRFSPLPRRRSSVSSDDGDIEPPTSIARKVSFADAFGFDLVSVKEFDTWEVPIVSQIFEAETVQVEEFMFIPSFVLPSADGMMEKLQAKKVLLESVDFIPGTTCMKGIIRVLNVSYEKQIYVRMSLDGWQSYYDLLAEYIPDSCTGDTDQFFFNISVVAPYQKDGAKVEFCICYDTAIGTFWDNNDGQNYILTCQKKEQIMSQSDSLSEDLADRLKKSCLKPVASKEDEADDLDEFETKNFRATEKFIPRIICSQDDVTDDDNVEETDNIREQNNGSENELELFLSQHYTETRITSSEDENDSEVPEQASFSNGGEITEPVEFFEDNSSRTLAQSEQTASDQLTQESEHLDKTEIRPTVKDAFHLKEIKEFGGTLTADDHNLGDSKDLPQDYMHKTEDNEEIQSHDLHEQSFELIKPYLEDTGPPPENEETETLSISKIGVCDKKTETSTVAQMDCLQSQGLLDDNANPSYSHKAVHVSYFSENGTDKTVLGQTEISDKMSKEYKDSTSNILQEATGFQLLIKDNEHSHKDEEHRILSQDLECEQEFDNNDGGVKSTTGWPGNMSLLGENTNIWDEKPDEYIKMTSATNICMEELEIMHEIKPFESVLDKNHKKDNREEEDFSNFQTEKVPISKLCYGSLSDSTSESTHYNSQNVKAYSSYSDENYRRAEHNFKNPLLEEHVKGLTSHEEDETCMYSKEEFTEQEGIQGTHHELSQTNVPPVELHPAINTDEYMSCASNITSESPVSQKNPREKVIIAVLTEEQSLCKVQTLREDFSKECDTNVYQQQDVWATKQLDGSTGTALHRKDKDLEVNICFNSGLTKEPKKEGTEDIELRIDENPKGVIEEMYKGTSLCKENVIHEGANVDQCIFYADNVPDRLKKHGELDVRYTGLDNPSDQSRSSFSDTSVVTEQLSKNLNEDPVHEKEVEYMFTEMISVDNPSFTEDGTVSLDSKREDVFIGPSIFISEPDDELESQGLESEEQNDLGETTKCESDDKPLPVQANASDNVSTDLLSISHVSSKVLCFLMFVVFSGLMYHYDFLVCFALYLFSLYWLYWEGDRSPKPVRKE
ncbi:phosphatase 1 regulatory subunit 3A [Pelobates cultripes]|uniref:Phosphatase 1 regulatory subunit 3A n=1 Tax=Pelobates cultripes TaxID=61616 RepID=A0AAD1RXK2_PELCU|nr:phosphatase 1 regulatory subunit 3A [Pelobates cultripes]